MNINRLKRSGHCITGFNTEKFYVLSIQYIFVFYIDLRTKDDYSPILQ